MSRPKKFEIKEFTTAGGKIRYSVSVTVHGQQKRKTFKTREEAETFLDHQRQEEARVENKATIRLTRLNEEELRDAENAVELLKSFEIPEGEKKPSLHSIVNAFIQNYKPKVVAKTFEDIQADFMAEYSNKWSHRTTRDYGGLFERLAAYFKNKPIHQIDAKSLIAFINDQSDAALSSKTWNNYKGQFNRIFDWASDEDRRYCARPTASSKLPFEAVRYGAPTILEAGEVEKLMAFAEEFRNGEIANIIALLVFAGIRPGTEKGEIFHLCLKWRQRKYLNLKTNIIYLDFNMTKTKDERTIKIHPTLKKWLEAYPFADYPPFPEELSDDAKFAHLDYRIKKFRELCPVSLVHDILRHTFCSYRAAGEKSLIDYLHEAGHTERIAKNHYLDRVTPEEAEAFWNILPKKAQ